MGDGAKLGLGLKLCTDSFTVQDTVNLINVLTLKYDLVCSLHRVREGQFRIYIFPKSMDKLRAIVLPYMVPSMLYKINM